jgi:hypothetical protein
MIVKTWMEECGKFEPAGGPVALRTCGMIVVSREMRQSDRKKKEMLDITSHGGKVSK